MSLSPASSVGMTESDKSGSSFGIVQKSMQVALSAATMATPEQREPHDEPDEPAHAIRSISRNEKASSARKPALRAGFILVAAALRGLCPRAPTGAGSASRSTPPRRRPRESRALRAGLSGPTSRRRRHEPAVASASRRSQPSRREATRPGLEPCEDELRVREERSPHVETGESRRIAGLIVVVHDAGRDDAEHFARQAVATQGRPSRRGKSTSTRRSIPEPSFSTGPPSRRMR